MRSAASSISQTPAAANQSTNVFAILRRNWKVFALVLAAIMLLDVLALAILQVRYVATGAVIVADPEINLDAVIVPGVDKVGDPADLESQILMIRAPRILRLALERPDVKEAVDRECRVRNQTRIFGVALQSGESACKGDAKTNETLFEQVQQHYTISAAGRSRVINIAYESPIPEVAQIMANGLTQAFLEDRRASSVRSREDVVTYLKQQSEQLQSSLKADEERIQAFRRSNNLMRGAVGPISSERLSSVNQSLTLAEAARADAAARLAEVKKARNSGYADLPTVIASRTIGDLKQQLATVNAQIASNAATFGPLHPSLVAMEQERASLRMRLDQEMNAIAASAQKSYDAANAAANSLKQRMDKVQTEAGTASDDEVSIANLVRDADIKRGQYNDLAKKIGDLETQKRAVNSTARLVSLAELPILAFFPKKLPFLAGGLTVGLMAAAGVALMRDRKQPQPDFEPAQASQSTAPLNLPIIAEVPVLGAASGKGLSRLLKTNSAPLPLAAAWQALRQSPQTVAMLANVFATLKAKSPRLRSVLVASNAAREGRSFTALALASAIATTGKTVLLLECDLQAPALAAALNLPPTLGLCGILQNQISPNDALAPTTVPNLFIIPAGGTFARSASLLQSAVMVDLLRWARRFDIVVLDSSPLRAAPDAGILAKLADVTLCCARADVTEVDDVSAALDALEQAGGTIGGVVKTLAAPARASAAQQPSHFFAKAS